MSAHVPMIVPGFNIQGDEVFSMECSCKTVIPGYTNKEAAIEGGKRHVASREKLAAAFERSESRK